MMRVRPRRKRIYVARFRKRTRSIRNEIDRTLPIANLEKMVKMQAHRIGGVRGLHGSIEKHDDPPNQKKPPCATLVRENSNDATINHDHTHRLNKRPRPLLFHCKQQVSALLFQKIGPFETVTAGIGDWVGNLLCESESHMLGIF